MNYQRISDAMLHLLADAARDGDLDSVNNLVWDVATELKAAREQIALAEVENIQLRQRVAELEEERDLEYGTGWQGPAVYTPITSIPSSARVPGAVAEVVFGTDEVKP